MYYLKATFGLGTDEALLEIPVSVTGNTSLKVHYQISSPKVELIALQSKAGQTEVSKIKKYADQRKIGEWDDSFYVPLNPSVEAIQLVAKKTGITRNVHYVRVDDLIIFDSNLGTGSTPSSAIIT